ncbi:hypothetical protein PMI17_00884, partial [Pantoea sp. GM01]
MVYFVSLSQQILSHRVAGNSLQQLTMDCTEEDGIVLAFDGMAYSETVCWRPALLRRPVIAGTLPARVESIEKNDTYACLDSSGRYRVKLDFDRSDREAGYGYLLVRMAKPYAGADYGWHAP